MTNYKELYLANCIEALNLIADPVVKVRAIPAKKYIGCLKELYKQSLEDPYDQEKLYILLARYVYLYEEYGRREKDTKFVELRFGQEYRKAKTNLSETRKMLEERYERQQLDVLKMKEKQDKVKLTTPTLVVNQSEKDTGKGIFNSDYITCVQLYSALEKKYNILLVDARPDYDFKESRVDVPNCINVPEQCIKKGLSANVLGQLLPVETQKIWNIRDTFDVLVLYDWGSTFDNLVTKLHELRSALVEWDPNRNYKEKPVILRGGYLELLQTYPMICTNPQIILSKRNNELDELIYLDSIEYPTETDSKVPVMGPASFDKAQDEIGDTVKSNDLFDHYKHLSKDRDGLIEKLIIAEDEWKKCNETITEENDNNNMENLKNKENTLRDNIDQIKKNLWDKIDEIDVVKEEVDLYVKFDPEIDANENIEIKEMFKNEVDNENKLIILETVADERTKALQKARALKPKITDNTPIGDDSFVNTNTQRKRSNDIQTPIVNRSNKPRSSSQIWKTLVEPLEYISPGKVGLKNIRNTCYMNAAIQCFRNLPDIKLLFCNGTYASKYNIRQPSAIIYETAFLVRYLWKNVCKYIEPIEFYQKICTLQPSYGHGLHEDSMEFFLFLLNHLSEDCSYKIEQQTKILTPRQKAWHKQFQGRNSVFQNLFYHQIKICQYCDTCQKRTYRFEMESTFMLSVPDHEFYLQDLMRHYMEDYVIKEYCCSICKKPVINSKQISYAPGVLVVVLKRYKQIIKNGVVTLVKQDSKGNFPINDFFLGENRYELNSIAMHGGDLNHGHYTAACYIKDDGWYEFDDHIVKPINIEDEYVKLKACAYFYTICDKK